LSKVKVHSLHGARGSVIKKVSLPMGEEMMGEGVVSLWEGLVEVLL
jgi:hypothetical protein